MLGRLLHTAASSINPHLSRLQTPLESTTEETHTHGLLYPDASILNQTQSHASPLHYGTPQSTAAAAASYDDRGGLDVQAPRDIRIIIAQDANLQSNRPEVLFDSQPPPPFRTGNDSNDDLDPPISGIGYSSSARSSNLKAKHGRQSSFTPSSPEINSQQSLPSLSPTYSQSNQGGLFGAARRRNSSIRPGSSGSETLSAKIAREAREDTTSLLDCMFGAEGFKFVTGTKIHLRPSGPPRVPSSPKASPAAPEPLSPRNFAKRRTPLTRSTTLEELRSEPESSNREAPHQPDAPSILITRTFSVESPDLSEDDNSFDTPKQTFKKDSQTELPLPNGKSGPAFEKRKRREKRVNMYAVAMVIRLPLTRRRPPTPPPRKGQSYAERPRSNQFNMASNTPDWKRLKNRSSDELAEIDYEGGRHFDYVLQRLDTVVRALNALESVAKTQIQNLLPSRNRSQASSSQTFLGVNLQLPGFPDFSAESLYKFYKQEMYLVPGALERFQSLKEEIHKVAVRVSIGLRTRRVITCQGRWGVWREEARWVGRWAGGKEQNFFFFNLLTAFLGNHTEWLDQLGPSWYRRRHTQRQHAHHNENSPLPHRTVIVSQDKMAARRLIFLLAAFLPIAEIQTGSVPRSSSVCYSQSPPSGVGISQEQSLRRTMNRRARGNSRTSLTPRQHQRAVSFSMQGGQTLHNDKERSILEIQDGNRTLTRLSHLSTSLPVQSHIPKVRKSSTTTTSTITADARGPVPHFAIAPADVTASMLADQSYVGNESLASQTLRNNLQRAESAGLSDSAESYKAGGWSSMISGFWSNRRGSSTEGSEYMTSSQEGLGIAGISSSEQVSKSTNRLSRMVGEVVDMQANNEVTLEEQGNETLDNGAVGTPVHSQLHTVGSQPTPAKDIPRKPKAENYPLKLSVDNESGIIDVEIPLSTSYSSSLGSAVSSPSLGHVPTSSLYDRSPMQSHKHVGTNSHAELGPSSNTAGWLKRFHEDFALQAVRPYDMLKDDVKRSMHAEISSPLSAASPEGVTPADGFWKDVCSTLIANTTNFTITRLRLQRRVMPRNLTSSVVSSAPAFAADVCHHVAPVDGTATALVSPECEVEEHIVEEPIMDMDEILIGAVERVLVQSGHHTPLVHSQPSSRAASPPRHQQRVPQDCTQQPRSQPPKRHDSGATTTGTSRTEATAVAAAASMENQEVPRAECRNMVIGALEQVVRSVRLEVERGKRGDGGNEGGDSGAQRENIRREWSRVGGEVGPETVERGRRAVRAETDSSLREGVRRWLMSVEADS